MISISRPNNFRHFIVNFIQCVSIRRQLVSFNNAGSPKQASRTPCLLFLNNKCAHFSSDTKQIKKNGEQILTEDFCRSLWSKQIDLLKDQNESNRFNYGEFIILLNEFKNAVFYLGTSNKLKYELKTLIKIFLIYEGNFQIGTKLINDSKNWTIVLNILKELVRIKPDKINKDNNILEPIMINLLMEVLNTQSDTKSSYPTITRKSKTTKIPDENYYYFQLIHSYFEYLRENKSEIKDSIFLCLLKSYSFYLESISKPNATNIVQLCKGNKEVMKHYETFNDYLELFMRKHPNFYSLSKELKEHFFEFFSYNKEKWSNSLKLIQNDANLHEFKIIYASIIGSIRFDNNVQFKWLCGLIKTFIFEQNFGFECQTSIDKFSIVFLNAKIEYLNDLEENLELLLETWKNLDHWPGSQVIDELNKFINEINYRKSDQKRVEQNSQKMKVTKIEVNYKGFCSNGYKLPIKTYDSRILRSMAEMLRQTNLPSPLKENLHKSFDELKEMLKYQTFDYVIDGMNVIYNGYIRNVSNFKNLLEKLDENKTKLIILKNHLKKQDLEIRKMEKMYPNLKFVYIEDRLPDDHFILYAAMYSGNETFVISNDNYQDSLWKMNEYKTLFRSWLLNRRILFHNFFKKLYYPPLFTVNVNKIKENTWLIPYIEKRESMFDEPKSFLLINRT